MQEAKGWTSSTWFYWENKMKERKKKEWPHLWDETAGAEDWVTAERDTIMQSVPLIVSLDHAKGDFLMAISLNAPFQWLWKPDTRIHSINSFLFSLWSWGLYISSCSVYLVLLWDRLCLLWLLQSPAPCREILWVYIIFWSSLETLMSCKDKISSDIYCMSSPHILPFPFQSVCVHCITNV